MTLLTTPHDSIPPADIPSWSGYSVNGGCHCWGCIGSSRIDHDVRLPSHSFSYYLYPTHNEVRFTRQLHQKHSVTFEATISTYSDKPMAFTFVTTLISHHKFIWSIYWVVGIHYLINLIWLRTLRDINIYRGKTKEKINKKYVNYSYIWYIRYLIMFATHDARNKWSYMYMNALIVVMYVCN